LFHCWGIKKKYPMTSRYAVLKMYCTAVLSLRIKLKNFSWRGELLASIFTLPHSFPPGGLSFLQMVL
jgi:hypothetical protein